MSERPFAVITGISSKIGMEMARQFASNGYDLLVTSPSDGIAYAEDELRSLGVDVTGLEVRLDTYSETEKLYRAIQSFSRPVDALVITFMNGVSGEFTETDIRREIHLINHNQVAVIHLTKLLLKDMVKNGSGKILYASSIPISIGSALEPVFESCMSFIMTFAESLQHTARTKGITITTMIPMVGEENQFENDYAGMAREGFLALQNGRNKVFEASLKTKLQSWAGQLIPDKLKNEIQRRVNEANSTHQ